MIRIVRHSGILGIFLNLGLLLALILLRAYNHIYDIGIGAENGIRIKRENDVNTQRVQISMSKQRKRICI